MDSILAFYISLPGLEPFKTDNVTHIAFLVLIVEIVPVREVCN